MKTVTQTSETEDCQSQRISAETEPETERETDRRKRRVEMIDAADYARSRPKPVLDTESGRARSTQP